MVSTAWCMASVSPNPLRPQQRALPCVTTDCNALAATATSAGDIRFLSRVCVI